MKYDITIENKRIIVTPEIKGINVIKLPYQILYYADGVIGMDFLLQFQAVRFDFVQKFIEIEGS